MNEQVIPNSERFLQKYRILEGLLEKRYEGEKISSGSVVMEYLRDDDSQNVRVDLDLLREIRNILSHNAGVDGKAVIEPSDEMLARLDEVIAHVRKPRVAADFGTPADQVLYAHPNDSIVNVMRNMRKNGYSHVPVEDKGRVVGVFSVKCIFDYLAEEGLDMLNDRARISALGDRIRLDFRKGERYMFASADASIVTVRKAFQRYTERNRRLSAVFVTQSGAADEPLICIITPWDVLSEHSPAKENENATGPSVF